MKKMINTIEENVFESIFQINDTHNESGIKFSSMSSVDHGFEHQSGQTKDYDIVICCFSAKHAALRSKTDWLRIRKMCPNGATFSTCGLLFQ